MAHAHYILLASDRRWTIGRIDPHGPVLSALAIDEADSPSQIASRVHAALVASGYAGQPLVLGLPSAWCLCATVATDQVPRHHRAAALLYRLEDKLPLAAEDLVGDFVMDPGANQALGVCAATAKLGQWVHALEDAGVRVQHLCPTALLATQAILAKANGAAPEVVLLGGAEAVDAVRLGQHRRPVAWHTLAADAQDVALALRVWARSCPPGQAPAVAWVGVDAALSRQVQSALSPQVILSEAADQPAMEQPAVEAAAQILRGTATPWVDLRRTALGTADRLRAVRRPLQAALAGALVLWLCLCGALLWRGWHHRALAVAHESQQVQALRDALPQMPPGGSPRLLLASEQQRLRGLAGQSCQALPEQSSALVLASQVLSRLPGPTSGIRYRLLDLRLAPQHVDLVGQARSHGDADALAASLRTGQVFVVDPPRTERLMASADLAAASGVHPPPSAQPATAQPAVSFTITATPIVAASDQSPRRGP